MSRKLKKQEIYIALSYSMYFNILNRLSRDHNCDGETDRETELPLGIMRSNIVRVRCALQNELIQPSSSLLLVMTKS